MVVVRSIGKPSITGAWGVSEKSQSYIFIASHYKLKGHHVYSKVHICELKFEQNKIKKTTIIITTTKIKRMLVRHFINR